MLMFDMAADKLIRGVACIDGFRRFVMFAVKRCK